MTGHVRPAIEQPMFGNVRVVLRRARAPAFAVCVPSIVPSGSSRAICWARSSASPGASAVHRGLNAARSGTSALPPLPEAALQKLLDVESRILRYANCIAVHLRHDGSLPGIRSKALEECKQSALPCTGASVQRQLLIPRTQLLLRSHPGELQCTSRREVSRRGKRRAVGLRAGSQAQRAGSWMTACTASGTKTFPGASGPRC